MIVRASATNARVAQILLTSVAKVGCRVAIETFPCARSSPHSQRAMLIQLSAHKAAKISAAATKDDVIDGIAGMRATSVPAVKRMPMTDSFAGSERQIKPSGWFTTRDR